MGAAGLDASARQRNAGRAAMIRPTGRIPGEVSVRVAVFSDIHGNAVALEAMLADLRSRRADRLVCLGDAIQGGAQPAEVVARLRALACPVVMGNADSFLLTGRDSGTETASAERRAVLDRVREWSLSRLSPADRDFIASFAPRVRLDLGGRALLGFHGSPTSFDDILLPETPPEVFERLLAPHAADFMAGGHVHLQFARRFAGSLHFNPGSVGVAYLHGQPEGSGRMDPWAEYAVLDVDGPRLSLEFHRVPYDVSAWIGAIRSSGRPHAEDAIRQYGGPRA